MGGYIGLAYEWQGLVGAFLGSSLAILASGVGFLIARFINRIDERREALRQVEISNTYSLQTAYTMQKKLTFFVQRARKLVGELRSNTSLNVITFNTINFSPLGGIFLDPKTHNSRIKSYYLHNKLLTMHAGTTDMNLILSQFKDDFGNIIRMNEMLIGLTSNNPNPVMQRDAYAENIEAFTAEVERFANEEIPKSIETMLQIRVYNTKLRKTFGRGLWARWCYEGLVSAKRDLNMVDHIDTDLEEEVVGMREQAEKRAARL